MQHGLRSRTATDLIKAVSKDSKRLIAQKLNQTGEQFQLLMCADSYAYASDGVYLVLHVMQRIDHACLHMCVHTPEHISRHPVTCCLYLCTCIYLQTAPVSVPPTTQCVQCIVYVWAFYINTTPCTPCRDHAVHASIHPFIHAFYHACRRTCIELFAAIISALCRCISGKGQAARSYHINICSHAPSRVQNVPALMSLTYLLAYQCSMCTISSSWCC